MNVYLQNTAIISDIHQFSNRVKDNFQNVQFPKFYQFWEFGTVSKSASVQSQWVFQKTKISVTQKRLLGKN